MRIQKYGKIIFSIGCHLLNFEAFGLSFPNGGSALQLKRYNNFKIFSIFNVAFPFQPSSCLTDREGGDQIYDYASKYRQQIRNQQAKMLMTPQG